MHRLSIDFGVPVGAEKARRADQAIVRKQLVPGNNVTFEYLPNWDIKIHANAQSAAINGIRDMIVEIRLSRRFLDVPTDHLDLQTGNGGWMKYYGTSIYGEVHHNWELSHKDAFQYTLLDVRGPISATFNPLDSIPTVVGVNTNKLRIVATDPMMGTRKDPSLWHDMDRTKLLSVTDASAGGAKTNGQWEEATPVYIFRVTEVRDFIAPHINYGALTDTIA